MILKYEQSQEGLQRLKCIRMNEGNIVVRYVTAMIREEESFLNESIDKQNLKGPQSIENPSPDRCDSVEIQGSENTIRATSNSVCGNPYNNVRFVGKLQGTFESSRPLQIIDVAMMPQIVEAVPKQSANKELEEQLPMESRAVMNLQHS